jgi:hypothetical protein
VNAALDGWTAATLPADWAAWRNRWEIGHAAHAALFLVAFCLLAWAGPGAGTAVHGRRGGATQGPGETTA